MNRARRRSLFAHAVVAAHYLNNALEMTNDFLKKTQNPPFTGEIVFERRAPHCWAPGREQMHAKVAAYVEQQRAIAPK